MCEQCLVNPLYFGEVLEGWQLIRARRESDMKVGDWGLVQCNDPTFTWSVTPTVDPTTGMSDDQSATYWEQHEEEFKRRFFVQFDEFRESFYGSPIDGFTLVAAAIKVGFDPDETSFEDWFFNYLGQWIVDHDPTTDEDPFPHLDAVQPHNNQLWKD